MDVLRSSIVSTVLQISRMYHIRAVVDQFGRFFVEKSDSGAGRALISVGRVRISEHFRRLTAALLLYGRKGRNWYSFYDIQQCEKRGKL